MSKRKEKILGELGFTYAGLSGKTQKDFGRGKPFIPFMNIMANGKIDPKFMGLVEVAPNERQNAVQKGDLFFTTSSETPEEVGMTSVLLEDIGECYLNSFCFGFRLYNFDDLIPEFAPYLFRGNEVRKQIINLGQGYTRFNLPKTELLKKLKLELPSENEQKKISEILTKADSIIEKTQAAIAKYKAIKQGMLQDLFTRGIDLNTNKLRPRYQDAPELYKESKLGMIPREWDDDVLGNIISVSSGEGLTQENIKPGIHLIYGGNGINGSHSEYLFEDSKLIIGRVGEYCGNAYITKPFSWVTDNALVVTPLKKVFLMNFWQYYLNFLDLNSLAFVGAQPVITGGLINKVVVKEIPEDEQILIAERLKTIDNKLHIEQTYLQKMQSLKKGLMEDLLSGRKQVKVSEPLIVTD